MQRLIPSQTAAYIPPRLRSKLHAGSRPEPEMKEHVAVVFVSLTGHQYSDLHQVAPTVDDVWCNGVDGCLCACREEGKVGLQKQMVEGGSATCCKRPKELEKRIQTFQRLLWDLNASFLELMRITHDFEGEIRY